MNRYLSALLLGLATLLGSGCERDGLVPPGDASGGGGDGAGGRVDLLEPDMAMVCRRHALLSFLFNAFEPVYAAGAHIGASVRVKARYGLRTGCDTPGGLGLRVMVGNATDFAVANLRAWRSEEQCGPLVQDFVTILVDGAGHDNPRFLLADGAPLGTTMTELSFRIGGVIDCARRVPTGGGCEGDCQCSEPSARCLAKKDGAFECQVPCSRDAECPEDSVCDVGELVCKACGVVGCGCQTDGDCRAGTECRGVRCLPIEDLPPRECGCDPDCGVGRLCGDSGKCVIPCIASSDCPRSAPRCVEGACGG